MYGSTGGGSAEAPGYYQSEGNVDYGGGSSLSGLGYQDLSAMAYGYGTGSTPDSSRDDSWVISPITFSGGQGGLSTSTAGSPSGYGSPSAIPPPPQFFPGELLQVEAVNEDGRYESETQEKALAPPPPPARAQPGPPVHSGFAPVPPYPYDMRFLTGQYLTGAYTDYTSGSEHGRDDLQENHYVSYDPPGSGEGQQWAGEQQEWEGPQPVWGEQQQQGQAFPSAAQQNVQMSSLGMPSGSGQQAQSYFLPAGQKVASGGKPQMSAGYERDMGLW